MSGEVVQFINEWNAEKSKKTKISIRLENGGEDLYGVDFRFRRRHYSLDEKTFKTLRSRVYTNSKNLMKVTSSYEDFISGILYVSILFQNIGYNPKKLVKTLHFILDDVFPELET